MYTVEGVQNGLGIFSLVGGLLPVPERIKTRAATFQYSAIRKLVCNGQLWASPVMRQLRSYKVGQREDFPATVLCLVKPWK